MSDEMILHLIFAVAIHKSEEHFGQIMFVLEAICHTPYYEQFNL